MFRAALLCALLAAPACKDSDAKSQPLDDFGPLPSFQLVDHQNQPFTADNLEGKVTVADFVFTRCQTICPVVTLRMKKVQQETEGLADDVQIVSFSVDPEHDTPEVLAEYASKAGADPRWRFVTGEKDAVWKLLDGGFMVSMDVVGWTDAGTPDVVHSDHFVLIDRRGHVRGHYSSSDTDKMRQLLDDVRRLVR